MATDAVRREAGLALRSGRLLIRPLALEDAVTLQAYRSDPEAARYQSGTGFDEIDAACLAGAQEDLAPDTPGTWFQVALVEAATGTLVGDCGLHFLASDPRQVELGITLARAHQGKGFARETVECLLSYLFGTLDKHRVYALTDADNRDAGLLFRAIGFRQEAHFVEHVWFKGKYGSEYLFAMLKREWLNRA